MATKSDRRRRAVEKPAHESTVFYHWAVNLLGNNTRFIVRKEIGQPAWSTSGSIVKWNNLCSNNRSWFWLFASVACIHTLWKWPTLLSSFGDRARNVLQDRDGTIVGDILYNSNHRKICICDKNWLRWKIEIFLSIKHFCLLSN